MQKHGLILYVYVKLEGCEFEPWLE